MKIANALLTEGERCTLTNGLRVAAERFDENARELRRNAYGIEFSSALRLADQFQRQARESRELAQRIDNAEDVAINDGE